MLITESLLILSLFLIKKKSHSDGVISKRGLLFESEILSHSAQRFVVLLAYVSFLMNQMFPVGGRCLLQAS